MDTDQDIDIASLQLPVELARIGDKKPKFSAGKPGKGLWWMAHPDKTWSIPAMAIIEMPDEIEPYFLMPQIAMKLKTTQYSVVSLHTVITHLGDVMLLPAKVNENHGYATSLRAAIEAAKFGYVRLVPNQVTKKYDRIDPDGEVDPPVWPEDLTFTQLCNEALKDRLVRTMDHPAVRNARGDLKK